MPALTRVLAEEFNVHVDIAGWLREDNSLENEDITEKLLAHIEQDYAAKIALLPEAKIFHDYERSVLMGWIDQSWREHLAAMDYLRQGIHLRGYAQKIRSRNTSVRRLRCSMPCGTTSAPMRPSS